LPSLNAFQAWLDDQRARALPKSPIGQAIAYTSPYETLFELFARERFPEGVDAKRVRDSGSRSVGLKPNETDSNSARRTGKCHFCEIISCQTTRLACRHPQPLYACTLK
jgi:hypothetical protein